jgi:ribosomal protein S18 acetylase RimI-like enzyme
VWVESISDNHAVTEFTCGNKAMDNWLARHALDNHRRRLSSVYVLTEDSTSVIGYYSLTMAGARVADLPGPLRDKLPPRIDVGAALLGRLAVATDWANRGLGTSLLVHAVARVAAAGEEVAVRFVAVDPIDERARGWYERRGFQGIEGDEGGRMFLGLDDAIAAFVETDWLPSI